MDAACDTMRGGYPCDTAGLLNLDIKAFAPS
jgi:hypothetical protein